MIGGNYVTPAYRVITDRSELNRLRLNRLPEPFRPPETWRDDSFSWSNTTGHTILNSLSIPERTLFGFGENTLTLNPPQKDKTSITFENVRYELTPYTVESRYHMLSIGPVKCIEHLLAFSAGLGITFDCTVSRANIPSYRSLMEPLLHQVKQLRLEPHARTLCAVKEPIGIVFPERGSSVIVDPPNDTSLVVDHQTHFRNHILGNQRISVPIEPATMGFFLKARSIAYGWRSIALRVLERLRLTGAIGLGVRGEDILTTTRSKILNPNPLFDAGINREAICHGVVDKLGAFALLPGFLIGTVTTDRTSHREDLAAAAVILDKVTEG